MAIISIAEAAELTGKSIKTIYRHIQNGKLSSFSDENNKKTVDISELIRVYGELTPSSNITNFSKKGMQESQMSKLEKNKDSQYHLENFQPDFEKRLLEEKIKSLELLLNEKQAHIESLHKAMLLIDNKFEKPNSQIDKKSWWKIFSR